MKAPNAWSCVPTAFAMATGIPLDVLLPLFPPTSPEVGYCLEDGIAALLRLKRARAASHLTCDGPGDRSYHAVAQILLARPATSMVLGLSSKLEGVRQHAVAYEYDEGQYIRCPEDGMVHEFNAYMKKWDIVAMVFLD